MHLVQFLKFWRRPCQPSHLSFYEPSMQQLLVTVKSAVSNLVVIRSLPVESALVLHHDLEQIVLLQRELQRLHLFRFVVRTEPTLKRLSMNCCRYI